MSDSKIPLVKIVLAIPFVILGLGTLLFFAMLIFPLLLGLLQIEPTDAHKETSSQSVSLPKPEKVYYKDLMVLSGEFQQNKLNEINGGLCFTPDEKSAHLIPRDKAFNDTRSPYFCFRDMRAAALKLGILDQFEDKAICLCEGKATIKINNYMTNLKPADVYDEADLVEVISTGPLEITKCQSVH